MRYPAKKYFLTVRKYLDILKVYTNKLNLQSIIFYEISSKEIFPHGEEILRYFRGIYKLTYKV